MDKRVEIHGTTRADMNGKRGVATDFHSYPTDRTKDRYTVRLDSGEAFKVRPASVRAEGTGGGGGCGAGKAKGKGKKGAKGGADLDPLSPEFQLIKAKTQISSLEHQLSECSGS